MVVRIATSEEIATLPGQRAVREATPEETKQVQTLGGITMGLPKGTPGPVKAIIQRVMGTDVDDPLELERLGTTALGAIGGAQVGTRVPLAPGPAGIFINPITGTLVGGLTGAVAGTIAPEATLELMEGLGLLPEGAREEEGLSDEELRRVVKGEALIEFLTFGVATGIRTTGRFVGRKATGIGKVEEDLAAKAAKEGIELAPFQLGKRGLGRGIVNVMGRFPIIGGKAKTVGVAAEATVKRLKKELPERFANLLSSSDLSIKLFNDATELIKAVTKNFNRQYEDLFLEANRLNVTIEPRNTTEVAEAVLEQLQKKRPVKLSGESTRAAEATELTIDFIQKSVLDLDNQSLAQMDELLMKIDQVISDAFPEIRKQVIRALTPIKGAVKADIVKNMKGADGFIRSGEVKQLSNKLAKIDADFSETMLALFETSTGKKISKVKRGGLKGVALPSEVTTQFPVDKIAKVLIDIDSPQAVDELARLLPKDTFKEVGSKVLADIFDRSMKELADGSVKLDADKLLKELGITISDKTRPQALERLFRDSGLDKDTLKTIGKAVSKLADAPIPNVSTFIARRAGIAGAKGVIRGTLPFLALGGAGVAGGAGALFGGLLFFGGARMLVSAVSNPVSSKAILTVLDKEAGHIAKRAAFLRMVKAGTSGLISAGKLSTEGAKELITAAKEASIELYQDVKEGDVLSEVKTKGEFIIKQPPRTFGKTFQEK